MCDIVAREMLATYILGLNMIIIPVIWARFDFRLCEEKKFELHPCKIFFV